MGYFSFRTLGFFLVLLSEAAFGMDPFEIQVYANDINQPGKAGLEIHQNYVVRGNETPAVFNGLADNHLWRNILEFSYAVSESVELGLYYQTAFQNDQGYYGGTKLRVKYLPKYEGQFFWGLNTEVGRAPVEFDPDEWGGELRPILGYDGEKWLVSFNPILGFTFGKGENPPDFDPSIKIGRKYSNDFMAGIEYYAELGKIDRMINAISEQTHYLFVAFDKEFGQNEINFSVGRGTTPPANDWIVKFILGMQF